MREITKEQLKGSILSVILEKTQEGPLPPDEWRSGEERASELSVEGYVKISHVRKDWEDHEAILPRTVAPRQLGLR